MNPELHFAKTNKASWNRKVDFHVQSEFYNVEGFLKGKSSLNSIELNLLGDIKNKKVLHLQCHFGQDTLSLARLGAKATGVDLSDKAIEVAKELSLKDRAEATFICCNVYELPNHLEDTFDVVFTSYGTIGWLPDINKWGKLVSRYLKPGGEFIFVEFHPVVWMFDDDFKKISYDYFNSGPIVEYESGTYADRNADLKQEYVMWNHSMSDVIGSLITHGLEIKSVNEFDYSPYPCFKNTVEFEPGKHRIEHINKKIPMVYAIKAIKKNLFNLRSHIIFFSIMLKNYLLFLFLAYCLAGLSFVSEAQLRCEQYKGISINCVEADTIKQGLWKTFYKPDRRERRVMNAALRRKRKQEEQDRSPFAEPLPPDTATVPDSLIAVEGTYLDNKKTGKWTYYGHGLKGRVDRSKDRRIQRRWFCKHQRTVSVRYVYQL